jgi:Protein of unknown function (DUF2909)
MPFNPELIKYLILGILVLILLSLATALYHLTSGTGDSGKMLKALTWRISLSVGLLLLLALAGHMGWFTPHDFGRPAVAVKAPTTPAPTPDRATPPVTGPASPNQP